MARKLDITILSPSMRRQLPYAASRALNDSAFAARADLATEAKAVFVLRNRYTERGFAVVKSHKRRLFAVVGSKREYLLDQVAGGRRPDKAIPTRAIRRKPPQRVSRSRWPRPLLDKQGVFMVDAAGSDSRVLVGGLRRHAGRRERLVFRGRRRKGRDRRAGRRVGKTRKPRKQTLRLQYVIPEVQTVRKRLDYAGTAESAFRRTFRDALVVRLADALRTAR